MSDTDLRAAVIDLLEEPLTRAKIAPENARHETTANAMSGTASAAAYQAASRDRSDAVRRGVGTPATRGDASGRASPVPAPKS